MAWGCEISSTGVDFASYDTLSADAAISSGRITVTCDELTSYTVQLSSGIGSYEAREMTGEGGALEYNLYIDENHIIVWGDGSGDTQVAEGSAGPAGNDHTVHARVPPRQNILPGAYADTVVVTIVF